MPDWCQLITPSVTFDFGTLVANAAVGVSKTQNIAVSCTSAIKYKLRLYSDNDSVKLTNGMTAKVTANGRALGTTLTGLAGSSTVPITVTLGGTPTSTGAYSGVGVIYLDYP
jgi:hypothetical protein